MSIFGPSNGELKQAVREAADEVVGDIVKRAREEVDGLRSIVAMRDKITALKEDLEALRLEKERKEEEFARKEREVEHKVGLERARQAFEAESAKKEARLEVREENLDAERERFEQQMKFERAHLEKQVDTLNSLVEKLLVRLPSAEIFAELGGRENGGPKNRVAEEVEA